MERKARKAVYVSKKTKQEKVLTNICIPSDLFEKISKTAPEVYGVVRGALSCAVEDGLKLWLTHYSGTLTGTHQNPRTPVRESYNKVMNDIRSLNDLDVIPTTLPTPHLTAAIMRALNIKERSALSWLFRFYVQGLIKPLNPSGIKIVKSSDIHHVKIWELVAIEA